MRRLLLGSAISIMILGSTVFGYRERETNVTSSAIGATAIGDGQDLLLGGDGDDFLNAAALLLVAGVRYLIVR